MMTLQEAEWNKFMAAPPGAKSFHIPAALRKAKIVYDGVGVGIYLLLSATKIVHIPIVYSFGLSECSSIRLP